MRRSSGSLSGSAGQTTRASPTARIAVARPSMPAVGQAGLRAGAAKPAKRISRSLPGCCSRSTRLPLRAYLLAIAIFCNEVKGKSMLALSRDLGVQYKTSFVLAHKMREAMAAEVKGVLRIGGEGRKAELDGGAFGGYVKLPNVAGNARER